VWIDAAGMGATDGALTAEAQLAQRGLVPPPCRSQEPARAAGQLCNAPGRGYQRAGAFLLTWLHCTRAPPRRHTHALSRGMDAPPPPPAPGGGGNGPPGKGGAAGGAAAAAGGAAAAEVVPVFGGDAWTQFFTLILLVLGLMKVWRGAARAAGFGARGNLACARGGSHRRSAARLRVALMRRASRARRRARSAARAEAPRRDAGCGPAALPRGAPRQAGPHAAPAASRQRIARRALHARLPAAGSLLCETPRKRRGFPPPGRSDAAVQRARRDPADAQTLAHAGRLGCMI
jgi:hypothetical protein